MSKKYLVASMDEREKTIAKLKANLYGISLDDLVKRSIDMAEFEVPTNECSYCKGAETKVRRIMKSYDEVVNGKTISILVKRYLMNVCPSCNAEYDNMEVSINLEKLVRYEVLNSLKEGKPIIQELYFEDIIKM